MKNYTVLKDRTNKKDDFFRNLNHLKRGHCFLCGIKLNKNNSSQEDLFPKWLLKKFNLYGKGLTLLNGTTFKYPILVECCVSCNTSYLSGVEIEIKKGVDGGYQTFSKIPQEVIFYWLSKILYGLLHKQSQLLIDQKKPTRGFIIPKDILNDMYNLHLFLKMKIKSTNWHGSTPWSIFIYQLQEYKRDLNLNYDFIDNPFLYTVAIRMGDIGVIASLQDGGALVGQFDSLKVTKLRLHPLQFSELTAAAFYTRSLLKARPKFISAKKGDKIDVITMPIQGLSLKPIFNPWEKSEFANYLSKITGLPYDFFYNSKENIVRTALLKNGKPHFIRLVEKSKKPHSS